MIREQTLTFPNPDDFTLHCSINHSNKQAWETTFDDDWNDQSVKYSNRIIEEQMSPSTKRLAEEIILLLWFLVSTQYSPYSPVAHLFLLLQKYELVISSYTNALFSVAISVDVPLHVRSSNWRAPTVSEYITTNFKFMKLLLCYNLRHTQ